MICGIRIQSFCEGIFGNIGYFGQRGTLYVQLVRLRKRRQKLTSEIKDSPVRHSSAHPKGMRFSGELYYKMQHQKASFSQESGAFAFCGISKVLLRKTQKRTRIIQTFASVFFCICLSLRYPTPAMLPFQATHHQEFPGRRKIARHPILP